MSQLATIPQYISSDTREQTEQDIFQTGKQWLSITQPLTAILSEFYGIINAPQGTLGRGTSIRVNASKILRLKQYFEELPATLRFQNINVLITMLNRLLNMQQSDGTLILDQVVITQINQSCENVIMRLNEYWNQLIVVALSGFGGTSTTNSIALDVDKVITNMKKLDVGLQSYVDGAIKNVGLTLGLSNRGSDAVVQNAAQDLFLSRSSMLPTLYDWNFMWQEAHGIISSYCPELLYYNPYEVKNFPKRITIRVSPTLRRTGTNAGAGTTILVTSYSKATFTLAVTGAQTITVQPGSKSFELAAGTKVTIVATSIIADDSKLEVMKAEAELRDLVASTSVPLVERDASITSDPLYLAILDPITPYIDRIFSRMEDDVRFGRVLTQLFSTIGYKIESVNDIIYVVSNPKYIRAHCYFLTFIVPLIIIRDDFLISSPRRAEYNLVKTMRASMDLLWRECNPDPATQSSSRF